MKIIASGAPVLHSKYGFKFIANIIELAGEGVLKKEYEKLKRKLAEEGLFAIERKKNIQEFPRKIGLITSENGAVIHDFLNNLGKYGYKIKFVNSRVEGQSAVQDLISAVDYFKRKKGIDVLVIIRGGGSLESLQGFNNEILIRKVSECDFPVICGIGHDKDVPLISLVADKAVSTPTAATSILNESWDRAVNNIDFFERDIIYKYQEMINSVKYSFEELSNKLAKQYNVIFQNFEKINSRFNNILLNIDYNIQDLEKTLIVYQKNMFSNFERWLEIKNEWLLSTEKQLKTFNPARQLKFGYSIVYSGKKIVKSIKQVQKDEEINIQVSDGKVVSKVKKLVKQFK